MEKETSDWAARANFEAAYLTSEVLPDLIKDVGDGPVQHVTVNFGVAASCRHLHSASSFSQLEFDSLGVCRTALGADDAETPFRNHKMHNRLANCALSCALICGSRFQFYGGLSWWIVSELIREGEEDAV